MEDVGWEDKLMFSVDTECFPPLWVWPCCQTFGLWTFGRVPRRGWVWNALYDEKAGSSPKKIVKWHYSMKL